MDDLILSLKPTFSETRLLLCRGQDEVLKARLPPPSQIHPRAAPTLCEALALWFQRPLCVVLAAADGDSTSALSLSDGFGFGARTVHYAVRVLEPGRRGHRLAGLGSFADLRQLCLGGIR